MATRAYKRDARGRFAGGGGGAVSTTYGRAGGFAKGNAFGGGRATSRQSGAFKRAALSSRGNSGRAGKGTMRGRMPDPSSARQYRSNVSRLQRRRSAQLRAARVGVAATVVGGLVAVSGTKSLQGRTVLAGAGLALAGSAVAKGGGRNASSLTAQIGAQTRKRNQLKNSTRLKGGSL